MKEIYYYIITLAAVFAVTALSTRYLIPILKSKKMGQKILEIGPRWHKSKEGTPTMGGLAFVFATMLVCAVMGGIAFFENTLTNLLPLVLTLLFALANALVGMIDDLTKFKKSQNEGLTPLQKLLLQTVFAAAYIALMQIYGYIDTAFYIPFIGITIEFGFTYYFFAMILILGIVNCANLTDGLDGLASTVALIIGFFFAAVAMRTESISLVLVSAAISGSALGFLVYNFYPARIFMGDTGSLFFGSLTVGCAFMINNPIIIIITGIVYVIEGISVVLQVGCYKLTRKRIFKMAPIHHHFEKCGWSEIRVVIAAAVVTLLFSAAAWFGIE